MEVVLKNLSKVFPGTKGRPGTIAVNDMNLTIPSGKLVGLLGPSGCGKSTTLYMIAGLHKPTGGEIYFGETEVTNVPPEKRGIGLVFQNYALYPHLSVRQNISFPLENVRPKISKEEINKIVNETARLVDIAEYLDRKPKQLSGGQQQRVAIARALAKRPQVLLLDEPLSNLDARLRLQTREEIKRIQKETGVTTIFVTHDQEEAMSISDEIVVMSRGVIQQVDAPQSVYDQPANLFVAKFLGSPAINVFDGEIKDNKLLVNGKTLDTHFEGKGKLELDSQNVYDALVGIGLGLSFEDYTNAINNFIEPVAEDVEETKVAKKVTKGKVDETELCRRLEVLGVKLEAKEIRKALDDLRTEQKLNREVKIAIRPENFEINEQGIIGVDVDFVEHIGRDISIVGRISGQDNKVRIIIPSELRSKITTEKIRFNPKGYFAFEKDGKRIK